MTSSNLYNMLNIKDHVWNETDKGLGFILLPCKKMIEAEKEMKQTLGAEIESKSSSEIIKAAEKEILSFESKLDSIKIQVLESFMHTRRVPSEEVKIPFLKLTDEPFNFLFSIYLAKLDKKPKVQLQLELVVLTSKLATSPTDQWHDLK